MLRARGYIQQDIRIDTKKDYEVSDWAITFGCTSAKVLKAIKAVGPLTANVKVWMAKFN
jgi:hypothetical protein